MNYETLLKEKAPPGEVLRIKELTIAAEAARKANLNAPTVTKP